MVRYLNTTENGKVKTIDKLESNSFKELKSEAMKKVSEYEKKGVMCYISQRSTTEYNKQKEVISFYYIEMTTRESKNKKLFIGTYQKANEFAIKEASLTGAAYDIKPVPTHETMGIKILQ